MYSDRRSTLHLGGECVPDQAGKISECVLYCTRIRRRRKRQRVMSCPGKEGYLLMPLENESHANPVELPVVMIVCDSNESSECIKGR